MSYLQVKRLGMAHTSLSEGATGKKTLSTLLPLPQPPGGRRARLKLWPVGPPGGWLASHTVSSATSSGSLTRSLGVKGGGPSSVKRSAVSGVRTGPGTISLTSTPCSQTSSERHFVNIHTAAFAELYDELLGAPRGPCRNRY